MIGGVIWIRSDADVEEHVVGWPPVKSSMKKVREQNRRECTAANYVNGGGIPYSYSMYVKVEMEGIGIARKIDLTTHDSYQSLTATLMPMFGKCKQIKFLSAKRGIRRKLFIIFFLFWVMIGEENVVMYKLTYQDKEGDWLLAGDVPWG